MSSPSFRPVTPEFFLGSAGLLLAKPFTPDEIEAIIREVWKEVG